MSEKDIRGRYEMPRTNHAARAAPRLFKEHFLLQWNPVSSRSLTFHSNFSIPQMGTKRALAPAPTAPSTPPTSPVTVKRIKIKYSTTDEALKEFNKEKETETLPHCYNNAPSDPTLIGIPNNRYKLLVDKRGTFIAVGTVVEHDVNIKKEVPPRASSSQF